MKKHVWLALIILLLSLSLFACDDANNEETTTPDTGGTTGTTAAPDAEDGQPQECVHQYGEWVVTRSPNCIEKGLQTRACTLCGKSETGDLDALGHDEVHHEAKAPTCTESGWDAYVTCGRCDYSTYAEMIAMHRVENNDPACKECIQVYGSSGLKLVLNSEETEYIVRGIGTCKDAEIVIPATYHGYPVTGIGKMAFQNCDGLTGVTILGELKTIEEYAFARCTSLSNITISDSVESIGEYAFYKCASLTDITIPSGVTSIGNNIFYGCTGLESILVDEDNPVYHSSGNCLIATESGILIMGCKSSIIPNDGSVIGIMAQAFYDCVGLTEIEIPDSILAIGQQAFYGCTGLTELTIPNSVWYIDELAFYGCTGLQSISVGSDNPVYRGGGNCLIDSQSQTLLLGCRNSVIPNDGSVTFIGYGAFLGCADWTEITIPESVSGIDECAFIDCTDLTAIYYLGNAEMWESIEVLPYGNNPIFTATVYYYAPDGAPDADGNYWRYVDGVPTPW